jgi:hypothetical protein
VLLEQRQPCGPSATSDVRPFYARMASISAMPDGCTIVDARVSSRIGIERRN